ncbi:hypothetical protein SAMN04487895_12354 [Paenibacillus sophorae]|uniref:Uncharacterized protein n=1 Tax=Paenibacillus sophorae TaxID=1333845 RepID=A0A1H8VEG6_9BACL|nr:hypothetical protein SAMN04487895_12354 [Paenibacillus sophorae]
MSIYQTIHWYVFHKKFIFHSMGLVEKFTFSTSINSKFFIIIQV